MMRRIVSIWLPRWPTDRWRRLHPASPAEPFALTHAVLGAQRLYAVSVEAASAGLAAGMTLAEARAICPGLTTDAADPEGDAQALERLARWAVRYSPLVSPDGSDGLLIDASGCAHLFGGEAAMLSDIKRRLDRAGLTARLAMADTPGAAWALARVRPGTIAPVGGTETALAPLPVTALRIADATVITLGRLGLKTIGSLLALDRSALARRFRGQPAKAVAALLDRLDQALGRKAEPIDPLVPLPEWQVRQAFMEPIGTLEQVEAGTGVLLDDLTTVLQEAERGVRRLRLTLYRVDGTTGTVTVGTSRPSRDHSHLMRLLAEKLPEVDAGFGIDLMMLAAMETEALAPMQLGDRRVAELKSAADLMDRLSARLGPGAVNRLAHRPSHLPERRQQLVGVSEDRLGWDGLPENLGPQPIRLLMRPEAIDVLAEIPEGPPKSFRWRRVLHRVVKAEGPDRIAPEWWLSPADQTRDYYRVEDDRGARFWLFRHGLYAVAGVRAAEAGRPVWYMHGLFA